MNRLTLTEWVWMLRHWRRVLVPPHALTSWRKTYIDWRRFWKSYRQYVELLSDVADPALVLSGTRGALLDHLYPCVEDATATTQIEPIYFYQDAWAFGHIVKVQPPWHVDVGSHHKYVALLSKVVPVTMVDIRPLSLPLDTLDFREGSILDLPFKDGSVPSLSSLCVVEHIGLGRYGDPLDPQGTEKAITELKRIVAPGGDLYVSVPLDDETRTYFNAHRAFREDEFLALFEPFILMEIQYIYGCDFIGVKRPGFGTGCFWFRKPMPAASD